MREKVGVKVVKALKRKDHGVTHAAVDMLCALMQVWNYNDFYHKWLDIVHFSSVVISFTPMNILCKVSSIF